MRLRGVRGRRRPEGKSIAGRVGLTRRREDTKEGMEAERGPGWAGTG